MNDSGDAGSPSSGTAHGHASRTGPQRGGHGEAGLFAPDSVTWRVHTDPLVGLAGLRAMLLQALHPVVMDAVDQHSDYRGDPWGRLNRLAEFVGVATFGSAAEAMLHGSRVRAVHARIRGRTVDGVEYAADDPQLLAWVHCCLVASYLEIVTRGGARLTGAEQDAYVAEQVRAAMLVGLEPDEVPHDRAGLLDYFRVIRPLLQCSPAARRAAMLVVHPDDEAGDHPKGAARHADDADVRSQALAAPGGTGGSRGNLRPGGSVPPGVPPGVGAGAHPGVPGVGPGVPGVGPGSRPGPGGTRRPPWAALAGLAYAALPPWARRLYDLPLLDGAAVLSDSATTTALRTLRTSL